MYGGGWVGVEVGGLGGGGGGTKFYFQGLIK